MQRQQLASQLDAQLGVQPREGLVEQKRLRAAHDGAAERRALAFALRQLRRHAVECRFQPQARCGLEHATRDLRVRYTADLERESDVLTDGEVGIQRGGLKHHRHVARGGRVVRHDTFADHHVTAGGFFQSGDAAQHRRLAGSRRAEQHEQLPVPHVEIQIVQRLNAAVEDFGQPAECDRRHLLGRQGDRNARAIAYTMAHTTKPVTITPGIFSIGFVVAPLVAVSELISRSAATRSTLAQYAA